MGGARALPGKRVVRRVWRRGPRRLAGRMCVEMRWWRNLISKKKKTDKLALFDDLTFHSFAVAGKVYLFVLTNDVKRSEVWWLDLISEDWRPCGVHASGIGGNESAWAWHGMAWSAMGRIGHCCPTWFDTMSEGPMI